MEFENLKICCDRPECGHEFAGTPPEWHNKPCPKCGKGVLITDEELQAWETLNQIMRMFEQLNALVDPNDEDEKVEVKFNFKVRAGREDGIS